MCDINNLEQVVREGIDAGKGFNVLLSLVANIDTPELMQFLRDALYKEIENRNSHAVQVLGDLFPELSPNYQPEQVLEAVAECGGYSIGWAANQRSLIALRTYLDSVVE